MRNPAFRNLLMFSCFLVIGYSVSAKLFASHPESQAHAAAYTAASTTGSIPTMNNGQRSILVILVDSIEATKAQLRGVWLVSYLPDNPTIHLLPILPAGEDGLSDFERKATHGFNLSLENGAIVPGRKFLQVLREDNYWWSGYIIVDQNALFRMVTITGEIDKFERFISPAEGAFVLPDSRANRLESFSTQLEIAETTCQHIEDLVVASSDQGILSLVPAHLLSDMDLEQLMLEWKTRLTEDPSPNCTFPSLQLSGMIIDG